MIRRSVVPEPRYSRVSAPGLSLHARCPGRRPAIPHCAIRMLTDGLGVRVESQKWAVDPELIPCQQMSATVRWTPTSVRICRYYNSGRGCALWAEVQLSTGDDVVR